MSKNIKLKVLLTNIRRTITSCLFISLSTNKLFGVSEIPPNVTCYAVAAPDTKINESLNVFILLVPIAIVIIAILILVRYIKFKKNLKEKNKEETK